MNAIETTGFVDAEHQLKLDEPLPIAGPSRVRVIILVPEAEEIQEHTWPKTAAGSPAFDFLPSSAHPSPAAARPGSERSELAPRSRHCTAHNLNLVLNNTVSDVIE